MLETSGLSKNKDGGIFMYQQCEVCEKGFEHKKRRKTCSKQCAYKLRGKNSSNTQSRKILQICKWCGGERYVSPAYSDRKFCSPDCWYESNSGENSPKWNGNKFYQSVTYEHNKRMAEIRRWIIEDRECCERCGKRCEDESEFHAHHKRSVEHEESRYDLSNIILLCRSCHTKIHVRGEEEFIGD
ncbi:hypothetical protein COO03_11825 [Bacillus sp. AFS098217]|uniref:HNH endonuclease signature motif containing protein n=1 Tax=unclassified Bacillus (in: firmicutes) TaxID=185979 RepID=UPI000BECD5C9|nr:hypothetical protein COO03_11825 [Bacillus sp. AFS098217]PEU20367.1 hypothetical protein CN525_04590 [Bacillus sp. AFS014408]